jgi:hypothetical protein
LSKTLFRPKIRIIREAKNQGLGGRFMVPFHNGATYDVNFCQDNRRELSSYSEVQTAAVDSSSPALQSAEVGQLIETQILAPKRDGLYRNWARSPRNETTTKSFATASSTIIQ